MLLPRQRLRTARSGHGAAVSDGAIWILAGWGGSHAGFLSSIECVHVQRSAAEAAAVAAPGVGRAPVRGLAPEDQWKVPPASLHLARHCPATAALGSYLYVAGGSGSHPEDASLGAQPTASVERLDSQNVHLGWDADVAPMLVPRYRHAMAVLGGQLYCAGGQTVEGHATASVERYDPRSGAWQLVTPMRRARFSHACATLGGRLYVVGGFAGGVWLTSVERYDPQTGEWESLSDLAAPVSASGLAAC